MFYWLFYEKLFHVYSPFRVFQYATFRTGMASLTALGLSLILGPWMIAQLRKFQIGQHIREDGPQSHHKKAGTPTMGGALILLAVLSSTMLWADIHNVFVMATAGVTAGYGLIGYLDDHLKIVARNSKGLPGRYKILGQVS